MRVVAHRASLIAFADDQRNHVYVMFGLKVMTSPRSIILTADQEPAEAASTLRFTHSLRDNPES